MAGEIIIPFIGLSFTVGSILASVVAVIIGYLLGSSAKNAMKVVFIFVGFVAVLLFLKLIPADILDTLKSILSFFQPYITQSSSFVTTIAGTGGLPTVIMLFIIGVILGWWRS